MFFKISEISYDGEHWYKADAQDQCILEANDVVLANPTKKDGSK